MLRVAVFGMIDIMNFLVSIIDSTSSIVSYTIFCRHEHIELFKNKLSDNFINFETNFELIDDYDLVLTDLIYYKQKKLKTKKKLISFNHASDTVAIVENSFHIFMTHLQLKKAIDLHGGVLFDSHDNGVAYFPQLNSYAFVVGFYHWQKIIEYFNKSKEECVSYLKDKYNFDINLRYPIVSYHRSEFLREYEVARSLNKLAEYPINILIKNYMNFPGYKSKKNIFVCNEYTEHMIRVVSDCNLTPVASGVLTSSFALGLKVIPVYTSIDSLYFGKILNDSELNQSDRFRSSVVRLANCNPIEFSFCPPIDISAVSSIYNLIINKTYWKNYEKKLPLYLEKNYGKIYLQESGDRLKEFFSFIIDNGI